MKQLKIYEIWQNVNNGYDTYGEAVVLAFSEDEAKNIHPEKGSRVISRKAVEKGYLFYKTWCFLEDVQVREIGIATTGEAGQVICASFNAG